MMTGFLGAILDSLKSMKKTWIQKSCLLLVVFIGVTAQGTSAPKDCLSHIDQPVWLQHFSLGVDVSKYQTITNWNEFTGSDGLTFVFVKATEGVTIENPDFRSDWRKSGAKKSNKLKARGPYHFFHPEDDAIAQADHFLSVIGQLEANDLPPALDLETFDNLNADDPKTQKEMINGILTWLQYVEKKTKRIPVIYTFHQFWETLPANIKAFTHYPLFLANYGKKVCPRPLAPWKAWTFLQYSETGHLKGVENAIDLDMFAGNSKDLQNFIDQSTIK